MPAAVSWCLFALEGIVFYKYRSEVFLCHGDCWGKIFLRYMGGFCLHLKKEDIASCLPLQSVPELCEVIVNSEH